MIYLLEQEFMFLGEQPSNAFCGIIGRKGVKYFENLLSGIPR
jgi:hypothetical protein